MNAYFSTTKDAKFTKENQEFPLCSFVLFVADDFKVSGKRNPC